MAHTFGSFDFNDGVNYRVVNSPEMQATDRDRFYAEFARREGGKLLAMRDRGKLLTFGGIVSSTTVADLGDKVDALQLAFAKEAQTLIYHVDGDTRRVTATREHLMGRYVAGSNVMWQYEVGFLAATPYAEAAAASQDTQAALLLVTIGGGQFEKTFAPTVGGTAFARPTFTATITTASSYSITDLQIANTSVSPVQAITIIQALVADDVIVFNSDTFVVTVNGVAAAVTKGQFPLLDPVVGATNTIRVRASASSAPTLTPFVTDWTARYHN